MMSPLETAYLYALLAGAAIPLGGLLARWENIHPNWLEVEFRHSVIAFGGGVLLAAVALVLVPEGIERLPILWMSVSFTTGGVAFFLVDRAITTRLGSPAQLMAMLLDFVPEAMAMGATLATEARVGALLALLIGLQNFPEGFNAYRELRALGRPRGRILLIFTGFVLLGPVCVFLGHTLLVARPGLLGGVMLFAAGGILYLTFEDIAPGAKLERQWAPPLGAVGGFLLGLVGHGLIT